MPSPFDTPRPPLTLSQQQSRNAGIQIGLVEHDEYRMESFFTDWEGCRCTILDIGANAGLFTNYCLRNLSQAQIYAFEPDLANIELFMAAVDSPRATIYPVAVSNRFGAMPFSSRFDESHICNGSHVGCNRTDLTTVQTIPMEMVLDLIGDVDLVKCDTEGSEWEIFYYLPSSSMAKIQSIRLEFHEWIGPVKRQKLWDKLLTTHDMTEYPCMPGQAVIWVGELR